MEYIYYYDIVALVLLVMLVALYFMRRDYPTLTNKIYLGMTLCCVAATITDLISAYSIPHADTFPLGLNYVINILYLMTYNGAAIFFYVYVLTITKQNQISKWNRIIYIVVIVFDSLLLLTTPFTKLMIYFDNDSNYCHGPLFVMLYVNSIFLLTCVIILFFRYRKNLSTYQVVSIIFFNITTIGAVLFQMIYPNHLVGNLVCSLFLLLVYISLQNPDHYINKNNQCYNLNAFFETIATHMHRRIPFTLIAFTLDGYQYINQILGVQAGNELLNSIVTFLHSTFGKRNTYQLTDCRFAILLEDSFDEETVSSTLQEYFKTPRTIQQLDVLLTPYICIVHYPDFVETPEDVNNAIIYSLKELTHTRARTVITASGASLDAKKRETQIIQIMKRAIRNNEFQVYYQPIFCTETKTFSSAEALVRLWDKDLGYIPPEEFIPMAERNGMIIEIGEIIFKNVCEFLHNNDVNALGIQYIEVNLSVVQCIQENLAQQLINIMKDYEISPSQINFEITETAGAVNADTLRRNMEQLIDAGGTFSMDDYGTGFSTANYLINLPMQLVKIDKSILWPAMNNQEAFIILRHTVSMLKALHKKIVVEGVETQEMADILIEMHCDYLQGYLYSKPIPGEDFMTFLHQN